MREESSSTERMNSREHRSPEASKKRPECDSSDSVLASTMIENDPSNRKKKKNARLGSHTGSTRRLERKKQREKKRRQDVNQGLEDLQNILVQVDPALKAGREQTKKILQLDPGRAGATTDDTATINRADLLRHATNAIKLLSKENQQQRLLIQQLTMTIQNGSGSTTELALAEETKKPLDEPSSSGLGRTFHGSVTSRQSLTDSSFAALSGWKQQLLQQQQQQQVFLSMRQAPVSDHTMPSFRNVEETSLLQAQLMQAQLESTRSHHLMIESLGLSTQQPPGDAPNLKPVHLPPSGTTTEQAQWTNKSWQKRQEGEQEEEDSSDDALW